MATMLEEFHHWGWTLSVSSLVLFAIKDVVSLPHATKPLCHNYESVTQSLLISLMQIYSENQLVGQKQSIKCSLERAKKELGSLILQLRHVLKKKL